MATAGQKIRFVACEELKDKYQHREDRIKSMCKAISASLQTNIFVSVARNGTVRFEFVGQRIKRANQYVEGEFCKAPSVRKGTKAFQPGQFSQAALQVMPDKDQEKLLREGNPFLLTEAALRKLDISMGVLQLRQFACEACDRVWWKTVPCTKPVSKCFQCKTKYDALPREKEFGIGRYRCLECNNSFFSRCEATSERPCFNCDFTVRAPYIHPKFKPIRRRRPPVDPSTSPFEPPKYEKIIYYVRDPSRRSALPVLFYVPLQRKPRKKVVNASTIHDSTGSTASTFVTQIEFPTSILSEAGTTDIVPVVISDPESDDEDVMLCSSSSDSESEEESSVPPQSEAESVTDMESTAGAMAGSDSSSDSDDPYPKAPRKRSAASSSSNSDSDSEQDADKKPSQTPLKRQSSTDSHMSADKESTLSSTKDSGLGTAGSGSLATGSSAPTRSTSGSDHGSVPPALYAGFNPTEFPGIVFSKFCAEENVTSKGAIIKGEGIKLSIPEGAIRPGDEVPIALQGCIGGPFVFPDGIVPVSPVYRIAPPCVFHQEVILTIEHFAELQSHEDCEEMVFITCPTKPKIKKRKGEPYWKFRISSAHLDCTPRGQHGDIRLTHFCLGALGRKLGRGQRYRYCASLYSPLSYIPPCCNAIFSVTLHHVVYIKNLERYLEKAFKDQSFLPVSRTIRSTEDIIELEKPTDIEGYKVVDHMGCQILKEQVDYALKFKRRAQSEISTYPPRIVLTFHQLDVNADVPLDCRIKVSGIREVPYFNLYLPPPCASEVSSQRSFEGAEGNELQMRDLNEIATYLRNLDTNHYVSLGGEFGLFHPKLNRMRHYPNDVVAAWLRREDDVSNKCRPTWRNLALALEHIGQNGIAEAVRKDHDR